MTASSRAAPRLSAASLLAGLAVTISVAASCTCTDARSSVGGCIPESALEACDGGDPFECEWGRLLRGRGDFTSLAGVIDGQPADMDALLRRLFPEIGDKPIVDQPTAVPAGQVFVRKGFDSYAIPVPVDWRADPYANNSWRLYFQSLDWFSAYTGGDAGAMETGAALLVDWVNQALYATPALDQSWADHALSIRLDRVGRLTRKYIADRTVLDRRTLHAAAQIIVTHLYALAADCCYTTAHNHGMMHDLALLTWVKRYPALRDGERIWKVARRRLVERQVRQSVTEDGIHIENTPCYHQLYVELLNRAIGLYAEADATPPEELIQIRDSMIEPLVHHLQPDRSFAQFGDCSDGDRSSSLAKLLKETRRLGVGEPSALGPLEWVVSRGKRGVAPPVDRVYEIGGYAFFRDTWGPASTATAGHFKAGHQSPVHYHADETAFEIFAHGHELIVGPGVYTYLKGDPFWIYQRSPAGQNVLVVDDDTRVQAKPSRNSRVIGHGVQGDTVWVQGQHANYKKLGVSSLVRTFAFAKPDTFVVIDHVRSRTHHSYAQHFHLHPDVSQLQVADKDLVVAGVEGGPSLAMAAAFEPDAIETPRGVADGNVRKGWYFPDFQVKVPAYDVVLRRAGREVDLPVVIVVSPPGQATRIPYHIAYAVADSFATVSWRLDGVEHSLRVPRP